VGGHEPWWKEQRIDAKAEAERLWRKSLGHTSGGSAAARHAMKIRTTRVRPNLGTKQRQLHANIDHNTTPIFITV
jgi:hypothetical protein